MDHSAVHGSVPVHPLPFNRVRTGNKTVPICFCVWKSLVWLAYTAPAVPLTCPDGTSAKNAECRWTRPRVDSKSACSSFHRSCTRASKWAAACVFRAVCSVCVHPTVPGHRNCREKQDVPLGPAVKSPTRFGKAFCGRASLPWDV